VTFLRRALLAAPPVLATVGSGADLIPAGSQARVMSRTLDGTIEVSVRGRWKLGLGIPDAEELAGDLSRTPPVSRLTFDTSELESWDSSLIVFLRRVFELARRRELPVDRAGLPEGVRHLLLLAEAPQVAHPPAPEETTRLDRLGSLVVARTRDSFRFLIFLGETGFAFVRALMGRARYRGIDLMTELDAAGVGALGVMAIVGCLLGTILAFVSTVTLRRFGATIYVADAVTIGMVRELGPIITAMVMAGRTGSAYAAQLGTMNVTDEIDAISTMSLPPYEFLVFPRLLALCVMMPPLCVFVDFVGLLAGGLVATSLNNSNFQAYLLESKDAIPLSTFWVGLVKSAVFGAIVAVTGCAEGMRAGKSAAAVGRAATSAVVQALVVIIAADGLFAVMLNILDL
jgi:phospholipid/cholesterol/gamma-HCH transport system permease protein